MLFFFFFFPGILVTNKIIVSRYQLTPLLYWVVNADLLDLETYGQVYSNLFFLVPKPSSLTTQPARFHFN